MAASPETRDVVVIGGGPAGLAAALGARRAGAGSVLVLEREPRLGGILNQCVHDGFGLFLYKETISGPEYAERLAEDVVRERIGVETGAMVLDLAPDRVLRVNSRAGYRLVKAGAVVLAMGCRERTRDMIGIPGTRPAGVLTAGSAQNLVNLQNLRVGNEAVILGSGDVGLIMARRLAFEGIKVKGVFEILPWASGLERNVRQCLMDFGIPLVLRSTVVEIRGRDRVESVVVAGVDDGLTPVPGTERVIPCDTLLLSVGLIPENELSKRAGVELSPLTGGAVVDETLDDLRPGRLLLRQRPPHPRRRRLGFLRGLRGRRDRGPLRGGEDRAGKTARVSAGPDVRYALPQTRPLGAAGVEWSFRVARPLRGVRVAVRGRSSGKVYARKKFGRVLPSELQKIKVRAAVAEDLEVGVDE